MIPVRLGDLVELLHAPSEGCDPDALVTRLTIDSRDVGAGALFVAIAGARVDGAAFIEDALAAGAVGALTTTRGRGRVTVADPIVAVQAIAADQRARTTATVVAITGSAGKTLTKDFTVAAVGVGRRVASTSGNQNNELGVPLTLAALEPTSEVLVVEVGSRGVGHIADLMPIVRPDVSIVLNVGHAHVGEFGGLERTAIAKRELVEGLGPDGIAVLNADDPHTRAMASAARRTILFGMASDADVQGEILESDALGRVLLAVRTPTGGCTLRLPLPGPHLAANALAALSVVELLGDDLAKAALGIEQAETTPGRMRIRDAGERIILDDTYNASPDSMAAGIKTLAAVSGRPRIAVLGFMAELGDETIEQHDRIGRLVTRLGIERLIVVGDDAAPILHAARHEGMSPEDAIGAADVDDALAMLAASASDAVILVKASRSQRLERIVDGLIEGGRA